MITDLLLKLEEEKNQWICEALRRLEVWEEKEHTAEQQIIQIQTQHDHLLKQKSLDLEFMESELKLLLKNRNENEKILKDSRSALTYLLGEIQFYEFELGSLEDIRLEPFEYRIHEYFALDEKKSQAVFKDRKISKLKESFKLEQTEMLKFYEQQLTKLSERLHSVFSHFVPSKTIEFETNPPMVRLSLKHGQWLDQYVNPVNFREDYFIVHETLERNNQNVFHFYLRQLNDYKEVGKRELVQLLRAKEKQFKLQDEEIKVIQEQQAQQESHRMVLEEKAAKAWWEWNQLMENQLRVKEILKEEFVKAVSSWQEKFLSEDTSEEEQWVYHQYGQRMMKQAERIIVNDEFE
jgi:hypothetical protein